MPNVSRPICSCKPLEIHPLRRSCLPVGMTVLGNTHQLRIVCDQEAEIKHYFQALSEGGIVDMPLQPSFWAPLFGMVTDQFGQGWMLSIETKP